MKHEKKFSQEQQQTSETQSRQTAAREFASVEELLRYDASQTSVPTTVAQRLKHSIRELPEQRRSWWRRLLD
jgi:ppGpp synthetase/RelA/SpoT-type nucleotidyltranferase